MSHAPPVDLNSPAAIFQRVDTDGSGRIDVRELQTALAHGLFHYDLHTVQALARLFSGRLGDTSLSLVQFTALHNWLAAVMSRFNAALAPGQTSLPQATARAALSALLIDDCTKLGLNPAHYTVDDRAFSAFLESADADAGSSLDPPEFVRAAVAMRGLVNVFKAFDSDKDGEVKMKFSQMVFAMAHVI